MYNEYVQQLFMRLEVQPLPVWCCCGRADCVVGPAPGWPESLAHPAAGYGSVPPSGSAAPATHSAAAPTSSASQRAAGLSASADKHKQI